MSRVTLFFLCILLIACNQHPAPAPVVTKTDSVPKTGDSVPPKTPIQLAIEKLLSDPALKNASVSLLVTDASTGETVAEYDPDLSLVPASTMKLFTTAAALEILGHDKRFETELCFQGEIRNGVLNGNIIIKGGGDPTLGIGEQTRKILYANWIKRIRKAGIDTVNGSIIGDGTIFDKDYIPYTWSWGEINLGYCAAASGLSLNGNTFSLVIDSLQRGRFKADLKKVTPYIPDQYFENMAYETETGDEEELYLIGHPFGDQKLIRGVIPKGKAEAELVAAISDPPLAFAADFMHAMEEEGIRVTGHPFSLADSDSLNKLIEKQEYRILSVVKSPNVGSIVYTVNHNSYNFFAETLLKQMGLKIMRYGGTDAGARVVYNFLRDKGMDMDGFYIFDGSGISRFNSATARQMVWVLKYMTGSPEYTIYRSSLSVAGVSGTLSHMLNGTPAEGNLSGKSGTMSRVKSLAGYFRTNSGRNLIFAITVNNFNCTPHEMTGKVEEVLRVLDSF